MKKSTRRKRPIAKSVPSALASVQDERAPQYAELSSQRPAAWNRLVCDPRTYCWLALILSLACLYQRLALIGNAPAWINSDTLWPVDLIIDLFVDHYHLHGWQFSIAPCWSPDVVLVGLAYGATRNAVAATILGGFLQFLLLVAGVGLCWRALRLMAHVAAETLTLLTAVWVTLYTALHINAGYGAYHQFFLPQTHIGNLVNVVWALGLALLLLDCEEPRRRRAFGWAYAAVCLTATMSNVLFAVHFLFPVTVAVGLLWATGRPRSLGMWLVLAGWPAAILGFAANKFLLNATDVSAQSALGWRPFRSAVGIFGRGLMTQLSAGDFLHLLAVAWLAGCAVLAFVLLVRSRKCWQPHDSLRMTFFVVASGASAASAAAMILGGTATLTAYHSYGLTMRYLHPMFFLPLFAWPIAAGFSRWIARERAVRLTLLTGAAASAMVSGVLLALTEMPTIPLHEYAPPLVRDLDSYARLYGLKYGVAGYWQARLITLLSKTGLRVYQVDRNLRPHHWVSNIEWYSEALEDRDRPPVFSFAVLHDGFINLEEGDVAAVFGDEGKELAVGGVPALVYSQRTQAARAQNCGGPERKEGSDTLEFAGGCLEASTGRISHGVWAAHAPQDTAGFAVLQLAPRLGRGRYTLEIEYSASADGDPNIAAIDIGYLDQELLYSGSLRADSSRLRAQFSVPHEDRRLGVRLFFPGFGALDVRRIILRRDSGISSQW